MKLSLRPAIEALKPFSRIFVERPRFAMVIAIVLIIVFAIFGILVQRVSNKN